MMHERFVAGSGPSGDGPSGSSHPMKSHHQRGTSIRRACVLTGR